MVSNSQWMQSTKFQSSFKILYSIQVEPFGLESYSIKSNEAESVYLRTNKRKIFKERKSTRRIMIENLLFSANTI